MQGDWRGWDQRGMKPCSNAISRSMPRKRLLVRSPSGNLFTCMCAVIILCHCFLTSLYHSLYSSLSYVFTLFNLSEEQAADILVSLCRDMGEEKISSAGKLLFFGSRILKSPLGKASLVPIKDMIKSTYRDEEVADTLVETSQL